MKATIHLYSPCCVTTEEAKQRTLARHSKRCSKPMFTHLPDSSHVMPATTAWVEATISKIGLTIVMDLPKLVQGKTCQPGQRRHRANRESEKRHKGWPAAGATRDPIEGTQHPLALYISPGQEVSITPPL
jgi:hypothetical protein